MSRWSSTHRSGNTFSVVPAKAGTHKHRRVFCEGWGRSEYTAKHRWLWVPAFAGTTASYKSTTT
jgi:hypothetical protein